MNVTDSINHEAAPNPVATGAFSLISTMQNMPRGVQLMSLATVFLAYCDETETDPRELLVRASWLLGNVTGDASANHLAMREYIRKEMTL